MKILGGLSFEEKKYYKKNMFKGGEFIDKFINYKRDNGAI